MKAITLLEPWASLIAIGAKKIETRSWATKYRGPLAIHSGKSLKPWHMNLAWEEPFFSALKPLHTPEGGIRYSHGCIIATCNLVDCVLMTPDFIGSVPSPEREFGHYEVGRYAWILDDIKLLPEPIPAKGMQRLWNWESRM